MIKILLLVIGFVSLAFGVLGVFLPLLPTTPFLLLSCICFLKSSDKMHSWLIEHKIFGTYLKNYLEKRGMSLRAKFTALLLLWGGIGYSVFLLRSSIFLLILLPIIALSVTIHILMLNTIN